MCSVLVSHESFPPKTGHVRGEIYGTIVISIVKSSVSGWHLVSESPDVTLVTSIVHMDTKVFHHLV